MSVVFSAKWRTSCGGKFRIYKCQDTRCPPLHMVPANGRDSTIDTGPFVVASAGGATSPTLSTWVLNMGPAAVRNVKTAALPLLVRAVFTGAPLGMCVSAGVSVFSRIQAVLYPEQFGLWNMNGDQIFSMAMLGLVVGAVAGLQRVPVR